MMEEKYKEATNFVEKLKKVEDEIAKLQDENSHLQLLNESLLKDSKHKDIEIGILKKDLEVKGRVIPKC